MESPARQPGLGAGDERQALQISCRADALRGARRIACRFKRLGSAAVPPGQGINRQSAPERAAQRRWRTGPVRGSLGVAPDGAGPRAAEYPRDRYAAARETALAREVNWAPGSRRASTAFVTRPVPVSSIALRRFQQGDASALAALFRASVETLARRDYTESQLRAWGAAIRNVEEFARRCAARMTWVALCETQVAGFSDLEPDGHIDMLYVHPRFARRGVARALLTQIESVAAARGIPRLYTEASLTARPVFERSGFALVAAQTVTVGGEEMPNCRMEKRLGPALG